MGYSPVGTTIYASRFDDARLQMTTPIRPPFNILYARPQVDCRNRTSKPESEWDSYADMPVLEDFDSELSDLPELEDFDNELRELEAFDNDLSELRYFVSETDELPH